VKLFGTKLNRLVSALVLRLLQRRLQKHLSQQIWMVKVLWIAFEKGDRRQFRLLDV